MDKKSSRKEGEMLNVSKEDFVLNYLNKVSIRQTGLALKARKLAIKWHGQRERDDGTPYFGHPNEVVYIQILLGFTDEMTNAAAFLHDTIEDEGKSESQIAERTNRTIAHLVECVSKKKGITRAELEQKFKVISEDIRLVFLKTIDRYTNMRRSMFGVYKKERMERYIDETENFILPISEKIINDGQYPEYEHSLRLLRSFIKGILEAAKAYVKLMEKEEETKQLALKLQEAEEENKKLKHRLELFMAENKRLKMKLEKCGEYRS